MPLANQPFFFSLSSPLTSSAGGGRGGRAKRRSNCIYVGRGGEVCLRREGSSLAPSLLCLAKKTPPGKEFTECQRLWLAFVPRNPILKHPVWFPLLSPKMPACREDKALGWAQQEENGMEKRAPVRCDPDSCTRAPTTDDPKRAGKQNSNSTWTYCSVRKSIIGSKTRGCTQFKNKT